MPAIAEAVPPPIVPLLPTPMRVGRNRRVRERSKAKETAIFAAIAGAGLLALVAMAALFLSDDETTTPVTRNAEIDVLAPLLSIVILLVLGLAGLVLYMAPTIIAVIRKHQNASAIAALNLLTGWSGAGWIAALVWAFTEVRSRDNYHYHQHQYEHIDSRRSN